MTKEKKQKPRSKHVKPPLGIIPERMWKEMRVWDLIACLYRHRSSDSVNAEWLDELRRLLQAGVYASL